MAKHTLADLRELGVKITTSPKIRLYFKEIVEEVSKAPSKVNKHTTLKNLREGLKTYSRTMAITDTMLIEQYIELVVELI